MQLFVFLEYLSHPMTTSLCVCCVVNGVAVCSPEKLSLDNGVHQEDGGTSSKKQGV